MFTTAIIASVLSYAVNIYFNRQRLAFQYQQYTALTVLTQGLSFLALCVTFYFQWYILIIIMSSISIALPIAAVIYLRISK